MLSPDFCFIHQVRAQAYLGNDRSGPHYGEARTLNCRMNPLKSAASHANGPGQSDLITGEAWFPAGTRMSPGSLVEFEGQTYIVSECRPAYDWFGENYVRVKF